MTKKPNLPSSPPQVAGLGRFRLRRGGAAHRVFCALDADQRLAILEALGMETLQRHGHSRRIAALRQAGSVVGDFDAIDAYLTSTRNADGIWSFGELVGRLLDQIWDSACSALGDRVDHPTVSDLAEMADALLGAFSPEWVRMFLAASVEMKLNARAELLHFNETDHEACPFLVEEKSQGVVEAAAREVEGDQDKKIRRRDRRLADRDRRREVENQRRRARTAERQFEADPRESEQSSPVEWAAAPSSFEPIEVSRLVHPHLPEAATNRTASPVGRVAVTFIWWGAQPGEGKTRPVLVVGSNDTHLWVRPIFSRDFKAGLWRAVAIDDWRKAGLDHLSYVGADYRKVRRSICSIGLHSLTLRDWNRVCRGEVHG